MVRIHPDPPAIRDAGGPGKARASRSVLGAVAQLGERLLCKQEVIGSIPFSSTNEEGSSKATWHSQSTQASQEAYL